MHPATESNIEELHAWLKTLVFNGFIEDFTALEEKENCYEVRIKPKFSVRPVWHLKIYIEETI